MPKIHDISLTLSSNLLVWPGDPQAEFKRALKMEKGDIANVTHMNMCVHTGTHVDALCHFLHSKESVEILPLEILTGDAEVIELPEAEVISAKALQQAAIPKNTKRLLIKTRNSQEWEKESNEFNPEYVAINADGAKYLVEKKIKLIGMDYLSVATFKEMAPTHEILLKAGIVIVEGLNLFSVDSGHYILYCLPLKIAKTDGAPARAILVQPKT